MDLARDIFITGDAIEINETTLASWLKTGKSQRRSDHTRYFHGDINEMKILDLFDRWVGTNWEDIYAAFRKIDEDAFNADTKKGASMVPLNAVSFDYGVRADNSSPQNTIIRGCLF